MYYLMKGFIWMELTCTDTRKQNCETEEHYESL